MSHPAKLINETSWRIVNGDYDEAIIALTRTLMTLKLALSGDARITAACSMIDDESDGCRVECDSLSSSSSTGFEYEFFSSSRSSSFLKTCAAVKGLRSKNINEHDPSVQSSCDEYNSRCRLAQHKFEISIFQDPIMVRGKDFRANLDEQSCEELSYVAIYNLALAHHLKSVELASSSEQTLRRVYLQKALSLYEHSHQILMKQTINVGVPVIHSMALVSNLGQIHNSLGDQRKVETCMQYLLSTIMYAVDCGLVDSLGTSIDGFFEMIMPLVSKNDAAAAA